MLKVVIQVSLLPSYMLHYSLAKNGEELTLWRTERKVKNSLCQHLAFVRNQKILNEKLWPKHFHGQLEFRANGTIKLETNTCHRLRSEGKTSILLESIVSGKSKVPACRTKWVLRCSQLTLIERKIRLQCRSSTDDTRIRCVSKLLHYHQSADTRISVTPESENVSNIRMYLNSYSRIPELIWRNSAKLIRLNLL